MSRTVLLLPLLMLAPMTVQAQTRVVAGQTVMAFDHDGADTTGYDLCIDTVSQTTCQPITVNRVGTTNVYTFILPPTVPRGDRVLHVRALWIGGASDPSDATTFRAVVRPNKPGSVRAS